MSKETIEIELRSEHVQEILNAVPTWMIRWGNTLFLGLIVLLLWITWFVKYPDVITSEVMISTKQPPQKEYVKGGGKIEHLLVADNQKVKANTPLAIVENTANYKDVFLLKAIIDTIKLRSQSFEFSIDHIPILSLGDIDYDYALFENSYLLYRLNRQMNPHDNEALANKVSIAELHSRMDILNAQKELGKSELSFLKTDLERQKVLYQEGAISLQDYELKQTLYVRSKGNFIALDASISQLRESISNVDKTIVGNTISRTKEDISLFKAVIQSFNQLKKSIKTWEIQYVLTSNIDGTVSYSNFWTENQTVSQGDLIFSIVPENNTNFIAKLKTPPQNSGKIRVGQNVNIQLENYPEGEFGTLQGRVNSISLLPDANGFYLIDVVLPSQLITSYKKTIEFKQEMKGIGEIVTEDLRLIERIFYQFRKIIG